MAAIEKRKGIPKGSSASAARKAKEAKLDHARLRHLLSYDPDTGVFRWRYPASPRVKRGGVAGCVTPAGERNGSH